MYHNELKEIIEKVVNGDIDRDALIDYLINNFDWEKIYDSNEIMVSDAFFTLKHYASGEEDVGEDEWLYFVECLSGKREFNIEEKMSIIKKFR